MTTTTTVTTGADDHGQTIRIEQRGQYAWNTLAMCGVAGEPNVELTITSSMTDDREPSTFVMTPDDVRAVVRYFGWQVPSCGMMGVLQANQALLEERRVSALPNEKLVAAALEARGIHGIIASRVVQLREQRTADDAAFVDRVCAELESVAASLRAAVVAMLPEPTKR